MLIVVVVVVVVVVKAGVGGTDGTIGDAGHSPAWAAKRIQGDIASQCPDL
jgi:hypothetical protein